MKLNESLPHAIGYTPENHLIFGLCHLDDDQGTLSLECVGSVDIESVSQAHPSLTALQLEQLGSSSPLRKVNSLILLSDTPADQVTDRSLFLQSITSALAELDLFYSAVVVDGAPITVDTMQPNAATIVEEMFAQCATQAIYQGKGATGTRSDIRDSFTRTPQDPMTRDEYEALVPYTKSTPTTVAELGAHFFNAVLEPDDLISDRLFLLHASSDVPTRDYMFMLLADLVREQEEERVALYSRVFHKMLDTYVNAPSWATDNQLAHVLGVLLVAGWQSVQSAPVNIALDVADSLEHECSLVGLMHRVLSAPMAPEVWDSVMGDMTEADIVAAMGGVKGPAQ